MKRFSTALKNFANPYVIILALPFLIFYWLLPFVSDWTLGNDYQRFAIEHQMELLFSLNTGSFPLYIPGFSYGQSASALTQGQIFHPIAHIASLLPGYWNGKALEWNTFLRLLSLAAAHLVLFLLLSKLKIKQLMAFILAAITVYNLRMLDLFRYGASLEAWTGYMFLCAAIGWHCLEPTRLRGPLSIIGATYWLVCSGQPQMMYYGLLGTALFALVFPFFVSAIQPGNGVDIRTALHLWLRVGVFCGLGILLSSAYILPFYFDFMANNAGRVAQTYAWADQYRDTFIGTLNNFFLPLRSDVHGAFGASSLYLVAVLIPLVRLFKVKLPAVIWIIWTIVMIAFLHMQGQRLPVHFLAYKFLPFASSFRIAGRISFIIPLFLMLLLAWVIRTEPLKINLNQKVIHVHPATLICVAASMLFGAYLCLQLAIVSVPAMFSPAVIRKIPRSVETVALASGIGALIALALYRHLPQKRTVLGFLVCIFSIFQITTVLTYGTWIEPKTDTKSRKQLFDEKGEKLDYGALPGYGLASNVVMRHIRRTHMEPFLGKIYTDYAVAKTSEEAYLLMAQRRLPSRVIVEYDGYLPKPAQQASSHAEDPSRVQLKYSSFNRLVFDVWATQPGFFGLAYPFSGHWKTMINHQKAAVYRANGISHAVRVNRGHTLVEFRYWSVSAFWGMIFSCATLIMIGLLSSLRIKSKPLKILVAVFSLGLGISVFNSWYQSLYAGKDLGTRYSWTSTDLKGLPNLAYGKQTYTKSTYYKNHPHLYYGGLAVDGNRLAESGFITGLQRNPMWMVDLYRSGKIGSIVIYESQQNSSWNKRPLSVAFSEDGKNWRKAATISQLNQKNPLRISFEEPQTARYVLVQASGYGRLSFDEIEIYPSF